MPTDETSRRAVLAATGATAIGLAGCLGGSTASNGGDGGDGASVDQPLPAPGMGPGDADVVVKAWEDFSCPHCASFNEQIVPKIRSNYVDPGTVRFEHHDFPIPVHPEWSWNTAVAARSVQSQAGEEAFWSFAKAAFANQGTMDWETIRTLADDAGVDPEKTVSDAKNGVFRPTVESDRQAGQEKGVRGTPTVFVNGRKLDNYAYARIESAIESALS